MILPLPTETNFIFETNKAERNILKKHRPAQKELLDKTNPNNTADNEITTAQNTTVILLDTNLAPTKIKSQKQNSSNTSIQAYKNSSYERKIDSLGKNNMNKLIMKNKVIPINAIAQKSYRDKNSSLESERQITINSKNSLPGKRKISSEQNIELLDRTTHFKSNKNNRTNQDKASIPSPTVNKLTKAIDKRNEQNISKNPKISIPTNFKILPIVLYN